MNLDMLGPDTSAKSCNVFEPKYKVVSAKQRKMREIYGENVDIQQELDPVIGESMEPKNSLQLPIPPSTPSRRKLQSDLIATTQPWSTPSRQILLSQDNEKPCHSIRRERTDLVPTDQFWTTPQKGPSAPVADPRRKVTDLIPTSLPWVASFGHKDDVADLKDRRRKKQPEEGRPSGVFPTEEPSLVGDTGHHNSSPSDEYTTTLFRVEHVTSQWNELTLKRLIAGAGIHVLKLRFKMDIFGDQSSGVVDLSVRHLQSDQSRVSKKLECTLAPHSMLITRFPTT
jgi:hypothetical protein